MDDRENLPDYESLTRCVRATSQNQFVEFTEKQLLYRLIYVPLENLGGLRSGMFWPAKYSPK